ncbi:hypothetical protein C5167_045626 [Papaver somniferum]|uniref:SOSEKI DIX-like domain-containing protein n=1 Tax=Papaver somniferum TaxID=3469 RepID=A0A4Y7LCX1_PAPSO|nr:uncharacterized protein DDB_G0271670-like [Papaver somniferum]XP_026425255.1 uncharacterized protein DDB_G0271670-like [Papaver somniferum]RZC82837.1 hypothetical protein C5167_045626 [Papaver somniferum]
MEGKVGGGVGGEIRRVHIIYFLSRMGRVEHPHLIRVHHLSKNGVHLRDVKRWLSELRGKDMPDAFAWSYKRRYKTGYVWQDLLDDDLISPISDNEYVIKGSEITTLSFDPCFHGEKKGSTLTKAETIPSIIETKSKTPDSKGESQFDGEDSGPLDSETSTESSESIKERNSDDDHQKQRSIVPITEIKESNDETENSLQKNEKDEIAEKQNPSSSSSTTTTSTARSSSSSSSSSSFNNSKSYSSGGATNVFRSLLSCRATDINDSALMMIHRSSCSSSSSEICKFENLGGSDMNTSGILWNQHQSRRSISKPSSSSSSENSTSKKSNEFGGSLKKVSAAFKPVAEPHCSQCGKGFKPERLHSHMKSCRGLKSLSKNRNSATAGYDFETEQKFTTLGSFKERNQQGCF